VPAKEADIPETRKQEQRPEPPVKDEAPPPRPSSMDLHAPMTYPDDGPFAKSVRKLDNLIGKGEQVVLVFILGMVILFGASHALLDKIAHIHVPYKDDVIKSGTFAIAMLGGAFASHQMKHLSMDLLSRRFSPRNRLFLRITLMLFVIFVLILLIKSGFANIANEKQFNQGGDFLVSRVKVAWLIPIGGALMIIHSVLHIIIDADYLKRGVVPPERMRSGH
jgi:TRAP-type mannitol/chloroaromatic compound transport system permease small subunit